MYIWEDMQTPHTELVHLINVAAKYNLMCVIKHCAQIVSDNLTWDNCTEIMELPKHMRKLDVVKKLLIGCVENIVASKFTDVSEIRDPTNNFLKLPHVGIMAILKNPNLRIDSECTIFNLLCWWTDHDKLRRAIDFESFLPHIRFTCMHYFYLLDIVSQAADRFVTDPEYRTPQCVGIPLYLINIRNSLLIHRREALENKIRLSCYSKKEKINTLCHPHPRKFYSPNLKFTTKCEFTSVHNMDLRQKYYSAPIFMGGYDFSYWIKLLRDVPDMDDKDTNLVIGGYLQCASQIMPRKYYLPVGIEISILQPPLRPTIVSKQRVIFTGPKNTVGGKLNVAGENFAMIKNKECAIIINDTLTVMVSVEILGGDRNCVRADDTAIPKA